MIDYRAIRSIRTNGKPDAALAMSTERPPTSDEYTMALLALLPMGHQPHAQSAAVIGFGSGMTSALLLAAPELKRVDTIEIEPAMIEGARLFGPFVAPAFKDPRSRIVIDDAKSYDIIVSEPSNPWVTGVASLFTEEFYARLAGYMNDDGVLCQWLHTYEMDATTLGSIFAAVSKTFPDFLVYSTIDSDIVVIARKSGAPGVFDGSILQRPALQPVLERLKLKDAEVVQRRAIATWRRLKPFFEVFGTPTNSDYYPIVEQRASKTRFTQVRVRELTDLNASAMPLLEMVAGAPPPSPRRHDTATITLREASTALAWDLLDVVSAGKPRDLPKGLEVRYIAARLVQQWAAKCPAEVSFDEVLPSMVSLAEDVNPHVDAQSASRLWKMVAASPCAAKLDEGRRRWLDLFDATARRDALAMARLGLQLLDANRGVRNASSEYAFFAALTGVTILGDLRLGLGLVQSGPELWIRPGTRYTEILFLEAQINAAARRSP